MGNQGPEISKSELKKYIDTCVCLNIRKASRAVTRLYDEALQGTGVRYTQLIILMVLDHLDNITVSGLAEELVMDTSTVARNLRPLEKQKLISVIPGKDRRQRIVSLTDKGHDVVKDGLQHWRVAQQKITENFTPDDFLSHLSSINNISDVVQRIAEPSSAVAPVVSPDGFAGPR
ncbi:MarR family winged helix-turn-helix transcriptional regulator [Emcibacter nanhaiensis]|uniref:Winged helix-turn-helix transcriptional regulator n=1 Tax=Emcibacter nanhaiensis TaxID=1505037 RepID=A0A501PPL6_9PROT|nr:MarR family winged helix-turn-helix transcriptional regulator [Emcibacter nanhaiensis]TPD61914.1 winged helix-turn-helix transcriptional regulator [Emcibacter nanhaiensis]